MKGLILIIITVIIGLFPRQGETNGKFQLFQGQYRFVDETGSASYVKALFKIDTETGELFLCEGSQRKERPEGKEGKVIIRIFECRPFAENSVITDYADILFRGK